MEGCSEFPKASALLEPHHQIVKCHIQDTRWGGSYPFAEVQLVYSTAPADWTRKRWDKFMNIKQKNLGFHFFL